MSSDQDLAGLSGSDRSAGGGRPDGGRPDGGRPDGAASTGHEREGAYSAQHGDAVAADGEGADVRVLDPHRAEDLRRRWTEVQAGFVDEPRQAVTGADQLVGEVLDEVSRVFREQRAELEKGWSADGGGADEPGTEDLRQALQRYRDFFDRLLSL